MRKIKFKTEYVPLSDDAIIRHKDFDQLMTAYVAAPKPNWFKQFIQKKWTMFGGGLMTGAIITSLLWYSQDITTVEQPVVQETKNVNEIQEANKNNTAVIFDSSEKNNEGITAESESIVDQEVGTANEKPDIAKVESSGNDKSTSSKTSSTAVAHNTNKEPADKVVDNSDVSNISTAQNEETLQATTKSEANENLLSTEIKTEEVLNAIDLPEKEVIANEDNIPAKDAGDNKDEIILPSTAFMSDTGSVNNKVAVIIGPPEFITTADSSEQLAASGKEEGNNAQTAGVIAGAAIITSPAVGAEPSPSKDKKEKKDNDNVKKNSDKDSSAFALLGLNLFKRDTTKNSEVKGEKKGWLAFGKDSAIKNLFAGHAKDSTEEKSIAAVDLNQDSLYIPRYAQVSFVTPLSSNGIDGYKYMHYVSLNVLQGYSGALKGVEIGGLLNGDKGYVTGAQFAGLGNYAGGNLKGAQFGGLANVSQSVTGAQFGGITNISGSFVNGFQAAGVVNVSSDSLNGVQIAGVVNILSSEKESQSWQVAGVGNLSMAKSKGGQIGGVFNIANELAGGQIGLINLGKTIKGFQIGLINISDSIDGVPIGLISISSHGIFDVNAWTSDFLAINGGVRVGSKYVYNIYSYGVSPFNDDLPFGFGIGIGGHIPIKRAFIDIDGMAWSMHRSYVSFSAINMINQLRVMGGFTFNKYFSVFAGPTLNVSVQDNRYDPFLGNYFFENVSENTTVRMAPGFVVGIRAF